MRHIDLKAWKDYTPSEKADLLFHWWHYYGKLLVFQEEQETFISLTREKPDLIWYMAVLSFQQRKSSQDIIGAMRRDSLDEYLESIKNKMSTLSAQELVAFSDYEHSLLSQTVTTYNNPEPDIPMDRNEYMRQYAELMGRMDKHEKGQI